MISGHIARPATYQLCNLPEPFPTIVTALRRLRSHKSPGAYSIEGWELTYEVCCSQTPSLTAAPIVSHRHHVVVKVCLGGSGQIDVWHNLATLEVRYEYQPVDDAIGWTRSPAARPVSVPLQRGMFVIVSPPEAYCVGVCQPCHHLTMATVQVPRELFGQPCRPLRQCHLANTPILCEL